MSTVEEIEAAIAQLPSNDLVALREWFDQFEAAKWDQRFEEDVASGKLDDIANQAIEDHRAGKSKEL